MSHRPLIFSMQINESTEQCTIAIAVHRDLVLTLGGWAGFVYSSIRASSAFICVHLRIIRVFTARRVSSPANRVLPV